MTGEDLLSTLEPYFIDGLSVNDIDKVTVLHDIFGSPAKFRVEFDINILQKG